MENKQIPLVVPAKAGIQHRRTSWIPAFAGMTAWALAALCGAAHAQGTAYVSSEKDDALTMIDLATLTVKGTVPTCKRGRHIPVSYTHLTLPTIYSV